MEQVVLQQRSRRFGKLERTTQLKRDLHNLERENNQLKSLVIRLSETIIRNVTSKQ